MQPGGGGPVAGPSCRHRPERTQIDPAVAARRGRFLLQAIEIGEGRREPALPDASLRAPQEQPKAALSYLGVHAVDRFGFVEQIEGPLVGVAPLGGRAEVQQRLEVPRVRLPPRLGLGLRLPGIARLPVGDERAKHARIGIGLPRAGQETAAVAAVRELAGPDQRRDLLLRVDVERVEHLLAIGGEQLRHVQEDARDIARPVAAQWRRRGFAP